MYQVTKTYGHERGLSCAFRQWKANHSHCSFIHGYALAFTFTFASNELNSCNWVIDFGGLDWLGETLKNLFDHKLAVAKDDPELEVLSKLHEHNLATVVLFEKVGCESFAEFMFELVKKKLETLYPSRSIRIVSVECREHGSNAATYIGE